MKTDDLARYYGGGRIGIGLLLLLFPGRVLQGMLGGPGAVTPGVRLLGRMLGVRDAIIGVGTLAASGGSDAAGLRSWTRYSALADATDAAAMVLIYRHLPKRKRAAMVAMALGGAATGAYLHQLPGD